jgi:hypothetical protein
MVLTLLADSRSVRQDHFDHFRSQCRFQVRSPKVLLTLWTERDLDFLPRHLADHSTQQALDFPSNFPCIARRFAACA